MMIDFVRFITSYSAQDFLEKSHLVSLKELKDYYRSFFNRGELSNHTTN